MTWYALRTMGRREFAVCSDLEDMGYEAFTPIEWRWGRRRRRRGGTVKPRLLKFPMIKGYVFANFEGVPAELKMEVDDLIGIVGVGRTPRPIPDDQIAAVKELSQLVPLYEERQGKLRPGQEVMIVSGPFTGHRSRVAAVALGKARVLLSLFGQSWEAEFDEAILEPA